MQADHRLPPHRHREDVRVDGLPPGCDADRSDGLPQSDGEQPGVRPQRREAVRLRDPGASSVFLYCFREREKLQDLFEWLAGQRMMTSFIRPGGLAGDFEPAWLDATRAFLDSMPKSIDEYESLLTNNPLFKERMVGV